MDGRREDDLGLDTDHPRHRFDSLLVGEVVSLIRPTTVPRVCPHAAGFAALCIANRPKRSANVGSTSRFNAVEVIRPPKMTIAIGPSISRPASPHPAASGNKPS